MLPVLADLSPPGDRLESTLSRHSEFSKPAAQPRESGQPTGWGAGVVGAAPVVQQRRHPCDTPKLQYYWIGWRAIRGWGS